MKLSKKLLRYYTSYGAILGYVSLALALVLLLFIGLDKPGSLSFDELSAITSSNTIAKLIANPINLPYGILNISANILNFDNLNILRGVSALFGLAFVSIFFVLIKHWYDTKTALLSTILVGCSSWFLQYARIATPEILLALSMLLLPSLALWLYYAKKLNVVAVMAAVILGVLIYIPGTILFALAAIIILRKELASTVKNLKPMVFISAIFLVLIIVAPLMRAVIIKPSLVLDLIGLPHVFSFIEFAKNLLFVPSSLFIVSQNNPVYNLGNLPILDIFTTIMLILGSGFLITHTEIKKGRMLLGVIAIGSILTAFNNTVSIIILLPAIYSLVATGIYVITNKWSEVFPLNPFAKYIGNAIVVVAVLFVGFYHINRYFFAWRINPVTKQSFTVQNYKNLIQ